MKGFPRENSPRGKGPARRSRDLAALAVLVILPVLPVLAGGCKSGDRLLTSARLIPPDYSYYFSIDGPLFLRLAAETPNFPLEPKYLKHLKDTRRIFGGAEIRDDGTADFVVTLLGDFPGGLIRTGLGASRGWKKVKGEEKYWRDAGGMELAPFTSRSIYLASGRMDDVIGLYAGSRDSGDSGDSEVRDFSRESGPGVDPVTLKDLETGDFVFLGEGDSLLREPGLRRIFGPLELNSQALESWSLVLNTSGGGYGGFVYISFKDTRQARAFITSYRLVSLPGGRRSPNEKTELENMVLDAAAERKENRVYLKNLRLSGEELSSFISGLF